MKPKEKKILMITGAIVTSVLILFGTVWWNLALRRLKDRPVVVSPATESRDKEKSKEDAPLAVSVAKNLEIPWSLDFLPDGSTIFTERPGRIRLIDAKEGLQTEPLLEIDDVAAEGEGGLLGLAVHPAFEKSPFIYVYYTYRERGELLNRVVRYRMEDKSLDDTGEVIIENIPGGSIHNGGRVKFGPDGFLYIATGDVSQPGLAQDASSLAGKILRLTDRGAIPDDNPYLYSPIYSLGHRNPQGLAWDEDERLWETEHGSSGTDEVNHIEEGKNYGWPHIRGDQEATDFESPVIHSGSNSWEPSGATFWDKSLFFVGLAGQSLYQLKIEFWADEAELTSHLEKRFGRLRDVVLGPDGFLYVLTSNRDSRGLPGAFDDQIIRINPKKL